MRVQARRLAIELFCLRQFLRLRIRNPDLLAHTRVGRLAAMQLEQYLQRIASLALFKERCRAAQGRVLAVK